MKTFEFTKFLREKVSFNATLMKYNNESMSIQNKMIKT